MNNDSYSDLSATSVHPQYFLRKGLGVWELTFAGRQTVLRHERGLFFVAFLLTHPPDEPMHAMALAVKAMALYCQKELEMGNTGVRSAMKSNIVPDRDALLQQRSLGLDEIEEVMAFRRTRQMLEAILDSENEPEPIKTEARQELESLYEHHRTHSWRTRDTAQRCVRAVTTSLRRLHAKLSQAVDESGTPHPVLQPFAQHLHDYILLPSGKCVSLRGGRRGRGLMAGCFTYEPPAGVVWSVPSPGGEKQT